MRCVVQIDQLSEVGIDRDQYSALRLGKLEQCAVAGVRSERVGLQNVVADATRRLGAAPAILTVSSRNIHPIESLDWDTENHTCVNRTVRKELTLALPQQICASWPCGPRALATMR